MIVDVKITSDLDLPKRYLRAVKRKVGLVIKQGAEDIETTAKTLAPKKSGSLAASIARVTAGYDGRESAASEAEMLYRREYNNQRELISSEYFLPKVNFNYQSIVICGNFYGPYVEGTLASRSHAQPFMGPALQKNRGKIVAGVRAILAEAKAEAQR